MPTTDEELAKKRERVEKLRQQVADEQNLRLERESAMVNDVAAAQLDAETTRLEAQLAEAKRANKASAVKGGASAVLDAVKADQVRADASLEAVTNPPSDKSENDETKG